MTKKSVARLVKDTRIVLTPDDLKHLNNLKNDLELKGSEAEAANSTWKLEAKKMFIKMGVSMDSHTFCLTCGAARRVEFAQNGQPLPCGCSAQPLETA
jgi:hypothetical protein